MGPGLARVGSLVGLVGSVGWLKGGVLLSLWRLGRARANTGQRAAGGILGLPGWGGPDQQGIRLSGGIPAGVRAGLVLAGWTNRAN